jgi:hypothetical protein
MSPVRRGYVVRQGLLERSPSREELITVAVVGLILLVAAGVATAAAVTSNTGAIDANFWGVTVSNISIGVIFVAGMLTTLVGVAGLLLLMAGLRRGRRLRQERRALRRENQRLNQQATSGEPPPAPGMYESSPSDTTTDGSDVGTPDERAAASQPWPVEPVVRRDEDGERLVRNSRERAASDPNG